MVLSIETASNLMRAILSRWEMLEDPIQRPVLRPAAHLGVMGMPIARSLRQPPPHAAMLDDVQAGIEHLADSTG